MKRSNVLPYEETLVSWWRLGNTLDSFDLWMVLSERCHGASIAMMDIRGTGPARASLDYAIASALAIQRAFMVPVTPPPATVSPVECNDDPAVCDCAYHENMRAAEASHGKVAA